jgi:hypothetical protein
MTVTHSGSAARLLLALTAVGLLFAALVPSAPPASPAMPRVRVSDDRSHFVLSTGERFTPWGFNYLGPHGHLAEEDWHTPEGWQRVEKDFREMRRLGANVVRWHLQFETYMAAPDRPKPDQLARLRRLLDLARDTGLHLDLTGLNCFRLSRSPAWYDALPEAERWAAQAVFWEAVAGACAGHPAVFCYNLTNEPVVGEPKPGEHPWLTGELGGFHFVQRVSNTPAGRDRDRIAAAWVRQLVRAIRTHDRQTLVTVGEIPWSQVWPTAKPVFYTPRTAQPLDFVSVHLYPGRDQLEKDRAALAAYELGKPLVVEEVFPLNCTLADLDRFIDATAGTVDGWVSHYFGSTIAEHRAGAEPAGPLVAEFLEYWQRKGAVLTRR